MLNGSSSSYQHVLRNLTLVVISLALLPLSTLMLVAFYSLRPIHSLFTLASRFQTRRTPARRSHHEQAQSPRRTVLVTGVGMTKGLTLARTFHLAGHRVIGADFAPYDRVPPCGRFSAAVSRFYALPTPSKHYGITPYINKLLQIVHNEHVNTWVSCSGVASAMEDAQAKEVIERRSDCLCIQFDTFTTQTLHSKDSFIEHTSSLGLPVPETHNVKSRDAVHKILSQSPRTKKRYIMKNVGTDDAGRTEVMTLLPRRTLSETYNHIAHIPISEENPWVLQQYVPGKREYCTHALVIKNEVKAFVACPSSDLLMHYQALPHPESALSRAMLRFTQEFVYRSSSFKNGRKRGQLFRPMTGHLSFDFLVDEMVTERGTESIIRAIECNPRAHTAVVLFQGREKEMSQAYLGLLNSRQLEPESAETPNGVIDYSILATSGREPRGRPEGNDSIDNEIVTPTANVNPYLAPIILLDPPGRYYWIGHDIITLVLLPLLHLFTLPWTDSYFRRPTDLLIHGYPPALSDLSHSIKAFLDHVLFWNDGTFVIWDPLPTWWLYHIYWPGVLLGRIWMGRKGWWSRANVSTCKLFCV